MDVTIREAEPSDVMSIDILRRQALEEAFRGEFDRSAFNDLVATTDPDLEGWIDSDRCSVLVAETEVTAVCYGAVDCEACSLLALYTSPDYQREGFASLLLDRLRDAAECDSLSATVPTTAREFFEAVGFERTGDTRWQGLPALQLREDG